MSTSVSIPPQQIRANLHQKIDQLSDADLELAGRQLEVFDLKQRLDDLCEDYGTDWQAGRATQEMVNEAIQEYRARHPGRPSQRP
jgi:hypothetical protein